MKKREHKYIWDTLYVKCAKCWEFKTIKEYNTSKVWAFWTVSRCKECVSAWEHNHYLSNRDFKSQQQREYYIKNKDKIAEHKKAYRLSHPEKYTEEFLSNKVWFKRNSFHNKSRNLVRKYWLLPSKCPICDKEWSMEIHHPSYDNFDKRSEVVICCKSCHKRIHSWSLECPTPINLLNLLINNH